MSGYVSLLLDSIAEEVCTVLPLLGRASDQQQKQAASPRLAADEPFGRSAAASDRPEQRAK
jgi:hypothetical protein